MDTVYWIGVDVAKDNVEVHVSPGGETFRCSTDTTGMRELVRRLKPLAPRIVAMEATGGHERVVAAVCDEAGLPIAIVNPRQVRKFAEAIGRLVWSRPRNRHVATSSVTGIDRARVLLES